MIAGIDRSVDRRQPVNDPRCLAKKEICFIGRSGDALSCCCCQSESESKPNAGHERPSPLLLDDKWSECQFPAVQRDVVGDLSASPMLDHSMLSPNGSPAGTAGNWELTFTVVMWSWRPPLLLILHPKNFIGSKKRGANQSSLNQRPA
jgi:hypothetical protein